MGYILNIETSGKNCSVAIGIEGQLVVLKEQFSDQYIHSEKLHFFVQECLKEGGVKMKDLCAVAVSEGPGSYTGLRIGVSAAKGIAFALSIPLISVSSLYSLCVHAKELGAKGFLCPMIDARRMEVYTTVFDSELNKQCNIKAAVIDEEYDVEVEGTISYFGDGAEKCESVLSSKFDFFPGVNLSAKNMIGVSWDRYVAQQWEDVAYFEPFYLKEFAAGKPKKLF